MHIPVLLQEVLAVLDPKPGEFIIDGTLGMGGHAKVIIDRIAPGGTFLGVDRDSRAVDAFNRLADFSSLKNGFVASGSYQTLPDIVQNQYLGRADGILLDLGFSSEQIDGSFGGRGFSFLKDEPLLMTYSDDDEPLNQKLRTLSQSEIETILREYGEERYAKSIASVISERKNEIKTTIDLVGAVIEATPTWYQEGRIHPATKTFQAFRIYVNQEFDHLKEILASLPELLKPGARIAIISFHSLEDRIVKEYFKEHATRSAMNKYAKSSETVEGFRLKIVSKKPIVATKEEIKINPRARSAKLRGAIVQSL